MRGMVIPRHALIAAALLAATLMSTPASAQPPAKDTPTLLPASIRAALTRAQLPPGSLFIWAAEAGAATPLLAHQADRLVAPASLMKLVTSAAALERLGPAFQWHTAVYLDGVPSEGLLAGSVYLKGGGDPRLVSERLWLLLRQLQQLGVREIAGDIVIDRSAYALAPVDPGAFDGEPLKPYNVQPDALLINQKSVVLQFRPEPGAGVARVSAEPALAGFDVSASVPLASGPCNDWRAGLQADFSDPAHWRLGGSYPVLCGERSWPVAHADSAANFAARAITAQWQALGGRLSGRVREGRVPEALLALTPALDFTSPPLAEVLRDMNKHSNNVIAQQVLLALSPAAPAQLESARASVQALLPQVGCGAQEMVLDKGSGLSREERITPQCLGAWLQWSWRRPWMPELFGSLPLAGVEGTARRLGSVAAQAHLKTGSLHQVAGLAGIVHTPAGRHRLVVALINDPQVSSDTGRAVLESVVRWTLEQ